MLNTCLTRTQLEEYARGSTHGDEARSCEQHLEACDGCKRVLTELFEAGNQPDWLEPRIDTAVVTSATNEAIDTRARQVETGIGSPADSTQHSQSGELPQPDLSPAHMLWQNHTGRLDRDDSASSTFNEMPRAIGRYRILALLGSGGFGRVYLAHDEKLKRNVAVKVPHLVSKKCPVHWDSILTEAQTVAALDHVGIVPIYDVASNEDVPLFLVSKLIEGSTLAQELDSRRFEPLEATQLVIKLLDALEYAHQQRVIHRDIKPQNILLDKAGQVYLADFGLAWRDAQLEREFPRAGTPFYMSPEQLAGHAESIDRRSDIFSLGKIFSEMLGACSRSGKASACPKLPNELQAICAKATAIDPGQRFQHASEFRDALQQFVISQTPWTKRHRAVLVGLVCIVSICSLFSVIFWTVQTQAAHRNLIEQAVMNLLAADARSLGERASVPALNHPQAHQLLQAAEQDHDLQRRLNAKVGLLPFRPNQIAAVANDLLDCPVDRVTIIAKVLLPQKQALCPIMWDALQQESHVCRRLNAATVLAAIAPDDERWGNEALMEKLLLDLDGDKLTDLKNRVDSLKSQHLKLLAAVRRILDTRIADRGPEERRKVTATWHMLIEDDIKGSIEYMLAGPPSAFSAVLHRLKPDVETISELRYRLDHEIKFIMQNRLSLLHQRLLAGLALLKLGAGDDFWPLWRSEPDPTHISLQLSLVDFETLNRANILARLRDSQALKPVRCLPASLQDRLFRPDLSERRNLLVAILASRTVETDPQFLLDVAKLYELDADSCVHGLSAQILLRAEADIPDLEPSCKQRASDRAWFINSVKDTMIEVPATESIPYSFAIAQCETQRRHFELFLDETGHQWNGSRLSREIAADTSDGQCAQSGLSWYDCAAYCNWLSRRENLEECYLPNADDQFAAGMRVKPNATQLSGYRIPSDAEWETAGRAGATTELAFGNINFGIGNYVWDMSTAHGLVQPVGKLRPNALGVYDVHGNVSEWTVPSYTDSLNEIKDEQPFPNRGGSVHTLKLKAVEFSSPGSARPQERLPTTGLRVVRTFVMP